MENLNLKVRLQNLSNELGADEAYFSYQAAKLTVNAAENPTHDVLLQSLDRISALREALKQEESWLRQELMQL